MAKKFADLKFEKRFSRRLDFRTSASGSPDVSSATAVTVVSASSSSAASTSRSASSSPSNVNKVTVNSMHYQKQHALHFHVQHGGGKQQQQKVSKIREERARRKIEEIFFRLL
jgi:hypothetical protein